MVLSSVGVAVASLVVGGAVCTQDEALVAHGGQARLGQSRRGARAAQHTTRRGAEERAVNPGSRASAGRAGSLAVDVNHRARGKEL